MNILLDDFSKKHILEFRHRLTNDIPMVGRFINDILLFANIGYSELVNHITNKGTKMDEKTIKRYLSVTEKDLKNPNSKYHKGVHKPLLYWINEYITQRYNF